MVASILNGLCCNSGVNSARLRSNLTNAMAGATGRLFAGRGVREGAGGVNCCRFIGSDGNLSFWSFIIFKMTQCGNIVKG